ncbi:phage tail length tape measure protein [Escherichia coli]|nr:phage tail length tape measure protein [Escherichia coli]
MTEQTSRLAIIIDSTGAKNNADNLTSSLVKMPCLRWGRKHNDRRLDDRTVYRVAGVSGRI